MTAPTPVVVDLETADADTLYTRAPDPAFVRLAGIKAPSGDPFVIDSPAGIRELVRYLERDDVAMVGANIFRFDIPALARHWGADYGALARNAVDITVQARLNDPPASKGAKPWGVKGYYALDSIADRLGVAGARDGAKGTLGELAAEYGGYDAIPVKDGRYRAYLRDDLNETEAVALHEAPTLTPYTLREMRVAPLQSRMTYEGWRIDAPLLAARVRGETARREAAQETLHERYSLPRTKGVSPLSTKAGKQWFTEALDECGVTDPPLTPKGAVSIAGEALEEIRSRPGLHPGLYEALGLMLEVAGTTAKYAEIAKFLVPGPDGDPDHVRVHGGIGGDQASGRWAMTKPSLTNLGKRGAKVTERAPFLPEPGHVLVSFDMDQVDMRAIAALSQDPAYMALFAPGLDAHSMIAEAVFGRSDGEWRGKSKRCGHGWNYGMSVNGLIRSGVAPDVARQFDQMMMTRFPVLCSAREEWRAVASSGALLDNGFGRLMRATPGRAHTQAPALKGQGGARDLMCEGLLRLDPAVHPMLRAVVHDEIVMSVPVADVAEVEAHVLDALTFVWRGVPITAGRSARGTDWAACYAKAA